MISYSQLDNIKDSFFLIAGPCILEDRDQAFHIAQSLVEISNKLGIKLIFKASYRKANRSRLDSFTGIGDQKALEIIGEIRDEYNIPTTTDIHSAEEANMA